MSMKRLFCLLLLLVVWVPSQAQDIRGDWKVEYTTATAEADGVLDGGTTVVTSDGKVRLGPPSDHLVGQVEEETLKELEAALVATLRTEYYEGGGQSVKFFLTHAGHRLIWKWQHGDQNLPEELKAAVEAFRAAVKSAKEEEEEG